MDAYVLFRIGYLVLAGSLTLYVFAPLADDECIRTPPRRNRRAWRAKPFAEATSRCCGLSMLHIHNVRPSELLPPDHTTGLWKVKE